MSSVLGFFSVIFQLLFFGLLVLVVVAFMGYNQLRSLAESIKESWSNIGVMGKKQASLVNQLIDVVKGYQESEKLVMLKVSEDMSNAVNVARMHDQSAMVLSAVSGMVQKFPDLKANQQYVHLIQSIQTTESDLEKARQSYNQNVKAYNTRRSALPHVFYAAKVGFLAAPYLEFQGQNVNTELGAMKSFVDDDGERINALMGVVGSTALKLGTRAVVESKSIANKAVESGRGLMANKAENPAVEPIVEKDDGGSNSLAKDKSNA
jgi:hypothetical protein